MTGESKDLCAALESKISTKFKTKKLIKFERGRKYIR